MAPRWYIALSLALLDESYLSCQHQRLLGLWNSIGTISYPFRVCIEILNLIELLLIHLYLICNQPSRCPNLSQMSYPTTTGGLLLSDQYLVEYRQPFISASISMMSPTIAQNNKRGWYFRCFLHHSLLRRLLTNRRIKNRHRRYPKWNDLFFIMSIRDVGRTKHGVP